MCGGPITSASWARSGPYGLLHGGDVVRQLLPRHAAEPDELLVEARVLGGVVDLGVPVAHVADHDSILDGTCETFAGRTAS